MRTLPPCARLDPQYADRVFFGQTNAIGAYRPSPEEIEAARHICATCPLRQACLDDALRVPARLDTVGVRAGTLPAERQALRVRWQITVKATGEEWRGGPLRPRRQQQVTGG